MQQNKLMKRTAIYCILFVLTAMGVMLYYSANKIVVVADVAQDEVIQSAQENQKSTLTAVVDKNAITIDRGRQNTNYFCIPMPEAVRAEEVTLENHYMDQELWVNIQGDMADYDTFYEINSVYGNSENVLDGHFEVEDSRIYLRFSLAGVYEYRSIFEGQTLYVEFVPSKEVYEKIRVNGDRDVTYRNIENFIERKKRRKLTKPIIEIKTMEMEENKDEIDQIMVYFRQLGGVLTTKRRLISWAGQVGAIVPKTPHDRIACGNAVGTMAITWDGVVTNCVMDVDAKYPCGDVNKETIKTIWKRRNEHMVSRHLEHRWEELPLICQNCMDWAIIGEERFDENGIPMNKNYDCEGIMIE